jgi:hypothetical protein
VGERVEARTVKAAVIALAIAALHPEMSRRSRNVYAAVLERDPDPLALVALIEHESRWQPRATGGLDHACEGLGQKCARFLVACRDGFETPACMKKREQLRDPVYALRTIVDDAKAWRALCRARGATPTLRHWLSGYGGFDGAGVTCGRRSGRDVKAPRVILDVEALRARLKRITRRR